MYGKFFNYVRQEFQLCFSEAKIRKLASETSVSHSDRQFSSYKEIDKTLIFFRSRYIQMYAQLDFFQFSLYPYNVQVGMHLDIPGTENRSKSYLFLLILKIYEEKF